MVTVVSVGDHSGLICANSMEIGEVGKDSAGYYYLRTYTGVVRLNDPNQTWSCGGPLVVRLGKPRTISITF